MRMLRVIAAAALLAPAPLLAQGADSMVVKTIPLHHLSNIDAVSLLNGYVMNRGTVFPAGMTLHAVTVRGSTRTIAEVEKVLAQYDRSPATITLTFQLVSADYTNRRDAAVAGLDSVLRSVLKFSGYHVLSDAVINVSEHADASQTLSGEGVDYRLWTEVSDVSGEGPDASVQVKVLLERIVPGKPDQRVLSTGVTIPIGHTVVLGTSVEASHAQVPAGFSPQDKRGTVVPQITPAGQYTAGSDKALILVVRPQISFSKKD
jgi:hypothetical protein